MDLNGKQVEDMGHVVAYYIHVPSQGPLIRGCRRRQESRLGGKLGCWSGRPSFIQALGEYQQALGP